MTAGEAQVVRAEVVAPLGHAVRLVDDEQRDVALRDRAAERGRGEALGRGEDDRRAGRCGSASSAALVVLARGEHHRRVAEVRQPRALVAHQRDQRRDDDGQVVAGERGQLVTEALAAAGGHDDERVAAVERGLDGLALARAGRWRGRAATSSDSGVASAGARGAGRGEAARGRLRGRRAAAGPRARGRRCADDGAGARLGLRAARTAASWPERLSAARSGGAAPAGAGRRAGRVRGGRLAASASESAALRAWHSGGRVAPTRSAARGSASPGVARSSSAADRSASGGGLSGLGLLGAPSPARRELRQRRQRGALLRRELAPAGAELVERGAPLAGSAKTRRGGRGLASCQGFDGGGEDGFGGWVASRTTNRSGSAAASSS